MPQAFSSIPTLPFSSIPRHSQAFSWYAWSILKHSQACPSSLKHSQPFSSIPKLPFSSILPICLKHSETFWSIPKHSQAFSSLGILKHSEAFPRMFSSILTHFSTILNSLKLRHSQAFSKYSQAFCSILQHSQAFPNILKLRYSQAFSSMFSSIPKSPYSSIPNSALKHS